MSSGRASKTRNLVEDENYTKIIDPYFIKKQSVIFMLAKILYGVIVYVILGLGIYFLSESKGDHLTQDLIDFNNKSLHWNNTYRNEFEDWDISIKNIKNTTIYLDNEVKKMHQYEDNEQIYYNPLQKVSKNLAPLIADIKLEKKKSDASVSFLFYLSTKIIFKKKII
jgi:hypothetical protein